MSWKQVTRPSVGVGTEVKVAQDRTRRAPPTRAGRRAGPPRKGRSSRPRRSPWAWAALVAVSLAVVISLAIWLTGAATGSRRTGFHGAGNASSAGASDKAAQAIRRVSDRPLVEGAKPVVFFMGGQFCPFCAADRWAFVKATSRFGKWTNLRALHSQGGTDGFASLPTYNLVGANYQSDLLSLHHKEVADVHGNQLQQLQGVENDLVNAYDPQGSIPFTVAGGQGGQYTVGLAFSPGLIQGQGFDQLRADVDADRPTDAVRAIDAGADAMTALLCRLTAGQPATVCSSPAIRSIAARL